MLHTVSDDGRRRSGTSVPSRELVGNPTGAAFELKREAGTLKFDRTTDAGGRVALTMDPAYLAAVADATGQAPTADQKLALFRCAIGLGYVRALKDAGYKVTLDELFELRNNGVAADYVVALTRAGYDFKPAQMVNLSRNGVGREFAVALRESGFVLSDEQLVKLSRNGIGRANVVKPETGHPAFDKACHLLGIEMRRAPIDPKTAQVDVAAIASMIDGDTVAIIGSACNYGYGTIDPIAELSDLALERGVGLHVDGGSYLGLM